MRKLRLRKADAGSNQQDEKNRQDNAYFGHMNSLELTTAGNRKARETAVGAGSCMITERILTGGLMRYVIIVLAIFLTVGLAATAQPPQAPATGAAQRQRDLRSILRQLPSRRREGSPRAGVASRAHTGGDRQRTHHRQDERSGRRSFRCRTCRSRTVSDRPGSRRCRCREPSRRIAAPHPHRQQIPHADPPG